MTRPLQMLQRHLKISTAVKSMQRLFRLFYEGSERWLTSKILEEGH
jgi:hypothetical protein